MNLSKLILGKTIIISLAAAVLCFSILSGCGDFSEGERSTAEGYVYSAKSPVSGSSVKVYSPEGEFLGKAVTDSNGYFMVPGVPVYESYSVTSDNGTVAGGEPFAGQLIGQDTSDNLNITPFTTVVSLLAEYDDVKYETAEAELSQWLNIDRDPFVAYFNGESLSNVNLDSLNYAISSDPEGVQGWADRVLGAYVRSAEPNVMWIESGGLLQAGTPSADEQAQVVFELALEREQGDNFVAEMRMTVIAESGLKTRNELIWYSRIENLLNRDTFIHFVAPAKIRNSTYLSKMVFGSSNTWLYSSAFKKIRRIYRYEYYRSFFDSDFTYEDIALYTQGTYSASELTETVYNQMPAFTVKVVKNDEHTAYSHAEITILRDTWVIVKAVMFDKDAPETAVKELTFLKIEEIQGIQTPLLINMKNLLTGSSTEFETVGIEYNTDLPADTFSKRNMEK